MFQAEDTLSRQFHECFGLLMKYRHSKTRAFFRQSQEEMPDRRFMERPHHRGQHKLLATLLKQDGLSQRDLVQEMDIRPSSVTELVGKLEQAGLVRKEEDANDKRITNIFLTDTGRDQATKIVQTRNAVEEDFFDALNDEEKAQLSGLLEKITASLKEKTAESEEDGEWFGGPDRPEGGDREWFGHGGRGGHGPRGGCEGRGRGRHHHHGHPHGAMRCREAGEGPAQWV